jgi:hypothetical protein
MTYRGPGVPISDLKLHPGSEFRTVNAFPIKPDWWVGGNPMNQPWLSGLGDEASVSEETLAAARRDAALANEAGIPVPVLRSIRAVESGASPSAVRFEPHLFWRTKKGLSRGTSGAQIRAALSASDAASIPYTPGPTQAASRVASETNRAAFDRAFRVDPLVAVKSTSWGSYQVLGGFLLRIFGNDPRRAVEEFDRNPAHLSERIFASWMASSPVAQVYARSLNFAGFAGRYNGCRDCSRYEAGLRRNYANFEPEWRAIAPRVGIATPSTLPSWAPLAIAGGASAAVLVTVSAGVWAVRRRRRPR